MSGQRMLGTVYIEWIISKARFGGPFQLGRCRSADVQTREHRQFGPIPIARRFSSATGNHAAG